jgi:uncharacterized protein YndB with AHSA1/START domain
MLARPSLTIKRRFKTTPQKAYDAWTNPQKLATWWGGSADRVIFANLDVREGGTFAIRFKSGGDHTGDNEHEARGTYKVVKPGQELEFTWHFYTTPERESYVRIRFVPDGDGTMMTFIHEQFADQAACDNHLRGWTAFFETLDSVLSQGV